MQRYKDMIYKQTMEVAELIIRGRQSGLSMIDQEKYLSVLRYMSWHVKSPATREREATNMVTKTDHKIGELKKQADKVAQQILEEEYNKCYWEDLRNEAAIDIKMTEDTSDDNDGSDRRKTIAKALESEVRSRRSTPIEGPTPPASPRSNASNAGRPLLSPARG
eukprot:2529408-Pyramimonas_sp.AAC.1